MKGTGKPVSNLFALIIVPICAAGTRTRSIFTLIAGSLVAVAVHCVLTYIPRKDSIFTVVL
jgi:hypothetical protein